TAALPHHDEHKIAVDHPALEVLGQDLDRIAEMKRPPKGDEEASRDVADHGPGRQEPDADDRRGAHHEGPQATDADAPDSQHQHRDDDPQGADQYARDRLHGLVGKVDPGYQPSQWSCSGRFSRALTAKAPITRPTVTTIAVMLTLWRSNQSSQTSMSL